MCRHNTRPSLLRYYNNYTILGTIIIIINVGPIQRLFMYERYLHGDFIQSSVQYEEIILVKGSGMPGY